MTLANRPEVNAEHMFVVRESEMYDRTLMGDMIDRTLRNATGVPGVDKMLEYGIDPLVHPATYGWEVIAHSGSKTLVAECEGTIFIYSMGSAATIDTELGANRFVTELIEHVKRFKPRHVWTAEVARLLRAYRHSGELAHAFSQQTQTLHAEIDIDIRTQGGQMMWANLSAMAAMERDSIVRRLTIGNIHKYRRHEWIVPAIPPGYRKTKGKKLIVDKEQVAMLRSCLPILVDDTLSSAQKCERMGDLRLARANMKQFHGKDATIADVRNSTSSVKALLGWLELWETGRYQHKVSNPISNISDLVGMAVHQPTTAKEEKDHPNGYFLYDLVVPLPKGGWGSAQVFNLGRQLRSTQQTRRTGGESHLLTKPFSGLLKWTDTHENKVFPKKGNYEWYRREIDPERILDGWHGPNNSRQGERIAVMRGEDIQRSVADGVAKAVKNGVAVEVLDAPFSSLVQDYSSGTLMSSPGARQRALSRQLTQLEEDSRRILRNANRTDDDLLIDQLLQEAEGVSRLAKKVQRELDELESQPERTLEPIIQTMGGAVAQVMAGLYASTGSVHRDARSALARVLKDARLEIDGDVVTWSLFVHINGDGVILRLGPIAGTVNINLGGAKGADPGRRFPVDFSSAAQSVLGAHPDQNLVERLVSHVERRPSDGAPDPLLDHLAEIYTAEPFVWRSGICIINNQRRQEVVDSVLAAGGKMTTLQLRDAGIAKERYARYSRTEKSGLPPVLARLGSWSKGPTSSDRSVALVSCPHCQGWATFVCLAPEIPTGVLCLQCRKMPTADSPSFPDTYFSS